ncbi:XRE family transcriptional regulator [Catellatospora sp. IY07-71]|uniref:hypothetical protein n=1 Tax=Catellatospora sp. IY07-71 TaxID=2728827 RepID=UPI001BB60BFC|nr:hypothetical protein [Catellatospora sp. IY07-71]BCJ70695.1 XRE family transcriptional regulator [Catellatospora sp. IY07-71]
MGVRQADDANVNNQLMAARLGRVSPSGSGRPMSRQEVADGANAAIARLCRERGTRPQMAGLTANMIGAFERGERRWPSKEYRDGLTAFFGMTPAELGLYIDRPSRTAVTPRARRDQRDVAELGPRNPQRREILRRIAAIAATSGLLGRSTVGITRIGAADAARLTAVTELYGSVDREVGGGLLCRHVAELAESATSLLSRDAGEAQRSKFMVALAGIRQLAGWTAFDAGNHAESQRHFTIAESLASSAGDARLAARVRYCQARQLQHLHHNVDAAYLLRRAAEGLAASGTPALRALLAGSEAASLAALGDHTAALNNLESAREEFHRIDWDLEPAWIRFYDQGELLAQYGRVYRDLARQDQRYGDTAVEWVKTAIANFEPTNQRSMVLNRVGLCSAYFLAGHPDEAIRVGTNVVKFGQHLTSRRILDRIGNVRRDIRHSRGRSDVADFANALAQFAPRP